MVIKSLLANLEPRQVDEWSVLMISCLIWIFTIHFHLYSMVYTNFEMSILMSSLLLFSLLENECITLVKSLFCQFCISINGG